MRKKLYFLIVINFHFFNAIAQLEASAVDSAFENNLFRLYENKVDHISFKYPGGWERKNIPNIIFTVIEKRLSEQDNFCENLIFNKLKTAVPPVVSLEKILGFLAENTQKNKEIKVLKKIVKTNSTGIKYGIFEQLSNKEGIQIISTQVLLRRGSAVYNIIFSTKETDFEKYRTIYREIIESIKM